MAGKIITNILPTKSYLKKYKVVDDDLCDRCKEESDSIIHNLWDCFKIVPILSEIIKLVKDCTNLREDISMRQYLFGLCEANDEGTNHVLLEAKMFLFYNLKDNINESVESSVNRFLGVVRNVMIKEKALARNAIRYSRYEEKWKLFTNIYDFRGPDNLTWSTPLRQ